MNISIEQATLIVSFLGLLVSIFIFIKQYQIEKTKIKLELYEKRAKVYREIMIHLNQISEQDKSKNSEERIKNCVHRLFSLENENSEFYFLFKQEDAKGLDDLRQKYFDVKTKEEREKIITDLKIIFDKYLRLD